MSGEGWDAEIRGMLARPAVFVSEQWVVLTLPSGLSTYTMSKERAIELRDKLNAALKELDE